MRHEQRVEFERLTLSHELPARVDDNVVQGDHEQGLLHSPHGSFPGYEPEFCSGISDHRSPRPIEQRPWGGLEQSRACWNDQGV